MIAMKRRWRLWLPMVVLGLAIVGVPLSLPSVRVALIVWFRDLPALDIAEGTFTEDERSRPFVFELDRHRWGHQVVHWIEQNNTYLLLTNSNVVGLSSDGQTRWVTGLGIDQWYAGGKLQPLPDGDLLAVHYCCASDSGVHLIRLDPRTGEKVWQTSCSRLGMSHSEYDHRAKAEIVSGKYIKVMSKGDGGSFVEILELKSGRSLARKAQTSSERQDWLGWLPPSLRP
jgi:hypothetical protein